MNKKIILTIILVIGVLTISGCGCKKSDKKAEPTKEALAFKEEYESLNGKEIKEGIKHRTVNIDEYNPFVKVTAKEIVDMIENGETFYVYFGDKLCPWCRSTIEKAIEVAKLKDIKKIYYVEIWDDEGNEILRDKFTLNKKDKAVKSQEGTEEYSKFLEVFGSLLKEYTLTTSDGKKVKTGERRIYAPNFIYVLDGNAVKLTTGNSDKQIEAFDELTDEILKDEQDMYEEFFNNK